MKLRTSILAILLLTVLCPSAALAQADKGTLLGTVLDTTGAGVPDTEVKATEVNTNIVHSAKTNETGSYTFPLLPPGNYRVDADHAGFKHITRTGVRLDANSTVRVEFTLELGSVSETLSVSASAAILQTDRADLGVKIETQTIQNMPLTFNRNYQGLLALVPGATRPFRPHSSFYNSQYHLSTYVNGQIRHGSFYLIEGINNDWDYGNLTVLVPPIESIQTVDVTTSNYDAEFGRVTGAITNVILRSGTNEFHGSAFEFNKVKALAAKNYFVLQKPPLVYNLFGGTIGGPIFKNKTFFFADFQALRDRAAAASGTLTIPVMTQRAGDFTAASTRIYDPATGAADGSGRQPFPNNTLPATRISPIARNILDLVPPPITSGAANNYPYFVGQSKNTYNTDGKVDHNFSSNDSLVIRYGYQQPTITVPPVFGIVGGPGNGAFAGTGDARSQAAGISYTHILSPLFLTQARFGVSRVRNNVDQTDFGTTTAKSLGIGGANIDQW